MHCSPSYFEKSVNNITLWVIHYHPFIFLCLYSHYFHIILSIASPFVTLSGYTGRDQFHGIHQHTFYFAHCQTLTVSPSKPIKKCSCWPVLCLCVRVLYFLGHALISCLPHIRTIFLHLLVKVVNDSPWEVHCPTAVTVGMNQSFCSFLVKWLSNRMSICSLQLMGTKCEWKVYKMLVNH